MKYAKIALIGFLCASLFNSCDDKKADKPIGPGDATVFFTNLENEKEPETESIEYTVLETSGLSTIPLRYQGTPGGYPITVEITATLADSKNLDDIVIITSQTIRITENNDSFVQIDPVNHPELFDDSVLKLTITEVTGANIGKTKECIVNIKNVFAVKYGQYAIEAEGGSPTDWTLILREGPDGQYIAENLFDMSDLPKLIGEYDAEKKQLTFDGRSTTSGIGSIFNTGFKQVGLLIHAIVAGAPLVFNVSDDWELTSLSGTMYYQILELIRNPAVTDPDDPDYYDQVLKETPASILGGGKVSFSGDLPEKDWPFGE